MSSYVRLQYIYKTVILIILLGVLRYLLFNYIFYKQSTKYLNTRIIFFEILLLSIKANLTTQDSLIIASYILNKKMRSEVQQKMKGIYTGEKLSRVVGSLPISSIESVQILNFDSTEGLKLSIPLFLVLLKRRVIVKKKVMLTIYSTIAMAAIFAYVLILSLAILYLLLGWN